MNKVKIGFFSFTEVTERGEHKSYNGWHQLDHIPENRALPGIAHGERWVASPRCVKARLVTDPMLAPVHYVTNYLITDPVEQTLKEFYALGAQLGAVGRFHRHRKAHLGGPFSLVKAYAAPRVLVAPEAIPYRPTRGIFVTVQDVADGKLQDAVSQWYDQVHIPDMMTVKGVAGVYWYTTFSGGSSENFVNANPTGRTIRVYYLDEDPVEVVEEMRPKLRQWQAAGRMFDLPKAVKTIFAGPFETITPFSYNWFD